MKRRLRYAVDYVLTNDLNIGEKIVFVKRYKTIFKYMTDPNAKTSDGKPRTTSTEHELIVQDNAIGQNARNILYIKNPSRDQIYLAVWKSPILVKYFNDDPEIVKLAIFRYAGTEPIAKYLKTEKLAENLIDCLLQKNPENFRYIRQTLDRQKKFVNHYANNLRYLGFIDDIHRDLQMRLLTYTTFAFELFKNPSAEVMKYVLKNKPHLLPRCQKPLSKKMCRTLLRVHPTNLRYIKNPTEEIMLEAFEASRWEPKDGRFIPDKKDISGKQMPFLPNMTMKVALLIARTCPQHIDSVPRRLQDKYEFQKALINTYFNTIVFENKGLNESLFAGMRFTRKIQDVFLKSPHFKRLYIHVSDPKDSLIEKAYYEFLKDMTDAKLIKKTLIDIVLKEKEPSESILEMIYRDYNDLDLWDGFVVQYSGEYPRPIYPSVVSFLIKRYDNLPRNISWRLFSDKTPHPDGEEATRDFNVFMRIKYGFPS